VRLLVAAGGTGGHIFPAIAVVEELKRRDPSSKVLFVGSGNRMESKIIPAMGFDFKVIHTAALPRRISPYLLTAGRELIFGMIQAMGIVRSFEPESIFITGGYVCAPVAFAGIVTGVPLFVQEQNAVPGLTNKAVGRWARRVFLGFEEATEWFDRAKVEVTGNPIRFRDPLPRHAAAGRIGLDPDARTLFVMGGSQGASAINEAMIKALPLLDDIADELQIVHQTGKLDYDMVIEAYRRSGIRHLVRPFFDEIHLIYSAADLMLCRAGGMTIAEITAFGLPAILVPFARATNDHQRLNALSLERKGAATVIPEKEISPESLAVKIKEIILDESKLSAMSRASRALGNPNAAGMILDSILKDLRR